ncbi:E3 ubiquitin-protein ligase sina-like [Hetaerina americana]|uniref:E3 ubiquitin-protein ligase sina-like n=1 Tax=Hetaerina americana TaxID=62018 RepID=UPI003A7F1284
MDKWKRIIEPAGDSESSGWSSDDSNASCSLSHYRLSQYYNSKMRTHTQEGRVNSRVEDDNPDDGCWPDFSPDYRGQSKKIRLSNVAQVNLNCSTSVVTLDTREGTADGESNKNRSDMFNTSERTWNIENDGSPGSPYLRGRYESTFFNEASTSYQDAEPGGLPAINNRNVNTPPVEARTKCFPLEKRKVIQSPTVVQRNLNSEAPEVDEGNDGTEDGKDKSTPPKSSGANISTTLESTVANISTEGVTSNKDGEQQKENGQLPNVDLNQSLISLLECPVCLEYVFPPINQCKRGHLVCANCKPQLNTCPTCRSRFNETRNLAMEQVAEKLYFPCRNHASGCKGMYLLQNKREHEANCHYRTYKCIVSHCLWKGFQPDILGHMVEVHKKIVVYGENQVLRLKLDTCVHFTQNWIISAFNQVFRVNFLVSYLRSQIAGCVQYLGPRKYACNYSYTFDISTDNRRLLYSRQTHGDTGRLLNVYGTGDCFFLRTDAANYFVTDKFIKIMLEIKKINDIPQ